MKKYSVLSDIKTNLLYIIISVLGFFSMFISNCKAQESDSLVLSYEKAIAIALNESYAIKSHRENKKAVQSYYLYHKAQFKPQLNFNIFTPTWVESVTQIDLPDGLPVYNSTGSLRTGGNLDFKYILPTGGNFSLYTNLYQEHLNTILATQNDEVLSTDQFFTQVGIGFSQPIFTKNTLKENLLEASILYKQEVNNYTKGQMDIIYNVTVGFYSLFRQSRVVDINNEKLKNSKEAYRVALLKYESKRIAEAEVLIAEVEMEKDKAVLSESLNLLDREKDLFKQQIGIEIDKEIDISTNIELDTFTIDSEIAFEQALLHRVEIANDSLNILLKKIDIDRAKRERELKGKISAYYDFTGLGVEPNANTNVLFNHSLDNMANRPSNRGVSLTFSYPISDWGRASAKKQQAKANLVNATLSLEDTKITIIREIKDIIRTIEESKNRVRINDKNNQLASRSYEISKLRYKNGDITSQQLAQEQERLSEAQLAYINSFITYQLAIADLKRKTMWDFQAGRSYILSEYTSENF